MAEAERCLPDQAIERYDAALGLWRGDSAFGEFGTEWWALADATRLAEMRIGAREQRAAARLALGHHDRALPDLESLAVEHPLRERPVNLLMQALHATGRQADALRRYQTFRERISDETGLDPTRELIALERSIAGIVEPVTDVVPGRPLRGYAIHEAIGEGAFGRVYAATQPGTDRRVAVKVIRPDLADSAEFVRRFETEAQLVARLEHPHIVPLYDYWREPGGAYLVFRYLAGGTARDAVISGGPWSLTRTSRLVEEIGGALMAAHSAGVTHNDVKAANVVLDDTGAAYLTDFGIALVDDDATDDDAIGTTGTHRNTRFDVCCFGWLVWELLTGAPQAAATAQSSVMRRRDGAVPSLIGRIAVVPDGLDAVLAKATAVEGGYPSVAEFVIGWRAALGRPEGVLTPITSPSARAASDSQRRLAAQGFEQSQASTVNPYKGLRPFDEADTNGFFGRTEAVAAMVEMVSAHAFVTVVGASGSGKSSLVRAGLVPVLRSRGDTVVVMIPGDDPLGSLTASLSALLSASLSAVALEGADAETEGRTLLDRVADASTDRLVVVIDQFEECWSRCSPTQRDAFLDLIANAARTNPRVRIVTTVRADLFDRPLQHPTIGHLVGDGAFVVSPLSPAQLDDVVVRPASRVGVAFDDRVIAQLVAEASAQPGSLPLLQFTLTELYDRRANGLISDSALTALGGMAGAIGRKAEEVYTELHAATQQHARELFGRLVVPGAPDTRRRARVGELSDGALAVSERFVAARLLVTDRDQATREPLLDVAHEALLARWPRLAEWIDEDRQWLNQLQHLAGAARTWNDSGRGTAELYRGARLESALEAVDQHDRTVSDLERQFIDVGRVERDAEVHKARRSAARLRRLLICAAAALAIAVIAGSVAVAQRQSANRSAATAQTQADKAATAAATAQAAEKTATESERTAKIEALVGRVEALRLTQRDASALLAIEAYRLANTPRSRSALLSTFTDNQGLLDTHRLAGQLGISGVVLPDGVTAFVKTDDTEVRPYDLETGATGAPLPHVGTESGPYAVLVGSLDGRYLAHVTQPLFGDDDTSTVAIYDLANKTLRFPPVSITPHAQAAAISQDGSRLFVLQFPYGFVSVFDAATGKRVGEIPEVVGAEEGGVGGLLALPDNRILVGTYLGELRIVDAATLQVTKSIAVPQGADIFMAPAGDGTSVVAEGHRNVMRVDFVTGAVMWQNPDLDQTCQDLVVIASNHSFYCHDYFGRLTERDIDTGKINRTISSANGNNGMISVANRGTDLVTFGNSESLITRRRLDGSGAITRTLSAGWYPLGYSPNGKLLLVAHDKVDRAYDPATTVSKVVNPTTGQDVKTLDGLLNPTWESDDSLLAVVAGKAGLATTRLSLGTGKTVLTGFTFDDAPIDARQNGTGPVVIAVRGTSSYLAADIFPLVDGKRAIPTIRVNDFVTMAVSAKGDRIAVATQLEGILVFDGYTGHKVGTIPGARFRGVYITPTDQLLGASLGGELTQYDLQTLKPVRTLGGSRGFVNDVLGTSDGSVVATLGGDHAAVFYDLTTGVALGGVITLDDNEANRIAISADGTHVAMGGGSHAGMCIWDLEPEQWVTAACRTAGRNLSLEEWTTNIGDLATYHATCPDFPTGA